MKINAHVLSAEDCGDKLKLTLQGQGVADAEWRPWLKFEVHVPDNPRNRRSFYLGRAVNIEVTPK